MKTFVVCVERFDAPDGRIWAVLDYVHGRRRWRTTRAVDVRVPVTTVFRGRAARQPKAYLQGKGRIQFGVARTVIHGT